LKQFKQILLTGILLLCIAPTLFVEAQKRPVKIKKPLPVKFVAKPVIISAQLKNFQQLNAQANVTLDCGAYSQQQKGTNEVEKKLDF
jgi:hypothetical protein